MMRFTSARILSSFSLFLPFLSVQFLCAIQTICILTDNHYDHSTCSIIFIPFQRLFQKMQVTCEGGSRKGESNYLHFLLAKYAIVNLFKNKFTEKPKGREGGRKERESGIFGKG